jgi:mRNA-degrading endonuclease RelE of RelBE toxin-antitoxin system
MDKIQKALAKLSEKERAVVALLLMRLHAGDTKDLDIKKLKGYSEIYRVRKGQLRIIFQLRNGKIFLAKIDRRDDRTYSEW